MGAVFWRVTVPARSSAGAARLSRCRSRRWRRLDERRSKEWLSPVQGLCRLLLPFVPWFCKRPWIESVSKELQARELFSTRYVTCSLLSSIVKNSRRSVGSSTRLKQKLYNFLDVFTKHFVCRCHRDNNPHKTSNADQVSATGRLLREAWCCCFLLTNTFFLALGLSDNGWTGSQCVDRNCHRLRWGDRQKSIHQSV